MMLTCLLAAALFTAAPLAAAAETPSAVLAIRAPRLAHAPTIDGHIHATEWRGAFAGVGLVDSTGRLTSRHASWWIGCDGKTLYFAMRSELPPHGKLLTRATRRPRDSMHIVHDDTIECWLAPAAGSRAAARGLRYQFVGNSKGAVLDLRYGQVAPPNTPPAKWNGPWQYASSTHGGWWEAELALPLDAVELDPAKGIRFRLTRDWKKPSQFSSTEAWKGGFGNPATMSSFTLDPAAPGIQIQSLGDLANADVAVLLSNPTNKPMHLATTIRLTSTGDMAPIVDKQDVTLAPGQAQAVQLKRTLGKNLSCHALLRVSDADGKHVWMQRTFRFRTQPPTLRWIATVHQPFRFQMMYQSYRNLVRARLKYSNVANGANVAKVRLTLTRQGASSDAKPIKTVTVSAAKSWTVETTFPVPDLSDGTYVLRCDLLTANNTDLGKSASVTFKRTHFPWEHNTIGLEDVVIPPFTPVKVDDRVVHVVDRDYHLSDLGLCQQIVSQGQNLLAAPMSLVANFQGKKAVAQGAPAIIAAPSPTHAVTQSRWHAGKMTGTLRSDISYDGTIAVTLTLDPCAEKVSGLTLNVPVLESQAPLMHSVGAGLRRNYGGKVPDGAVPWTNLKAWTYEVPDHFLPYLWVGGTSRGLAWYADSDRGWVVDQKNPLMLRLVRQDKSLVLQLRLIGAPTMLTQQRVIRFYFQATPIKPRPANWRRLTAVAHIPNTRRLMILGACLYWGGLSPFGDVYPRDKDLSIWRRLAQIRKRHRFTADDRRFAAQWLKGYPQNGLNEKYKRSTFAGLLMASVADSLVPYTDARATQMGIPESREFIDAWSAEPFQRQTWTSDPTQYVRFDPTRSQQDFMLWWYQKMMQTHMATGIYYDNTFLWPNTNTFASTDAWTDDHGVVHPSVGVRDMRELVKRTAVMQAQGGYAHDNIVHMTNAATAPVLTFATINLGWEWHYGATDFQDRFPADYIRACTIGTQFGTIPLVLTGVIPDKAHSSTWITRTLLATVLPHEVKLWPTRGVDHKLIEKIYGKLFGFGYGLPSCQIYHYWDPNRPFHSSRHDVKCLLLANHGKLLLIASDFGNGGPCRVTIDAKQWPTGSDVSATNMETDTPITINNKTLVFTLKKHDFNMIEITAKP